ncbi:MAG TPA: thioredoxin [Actinomycetaceae bacterium]|nr:thioredoxin [Actinomycetaceae bacterium]
MTARPVDQASFDTEVLESSKPVLVDFWAEWCGPCRALGPILDQISEERGEDLEVVKVNVDENQDLALRYQVISIPTMKLFKDGEILHTISGARSKGALLKELDPHLGS